MPERKAPTYSAVKANFIGLLLAVMIVFPTATAAGDWQYSEKEDLMRGVKNRWATLPSTNTVELDFPYRGGSHLGIVLRDMPKTNGTDAILQLTKGQMSCSSQTCRVNVKFDEGPVKSFVAYRAAGGETSLLFLQAKGDFIKQLRASKRAVVEVPIWKRGPEQFVFDTSNLVWK